MLWLGLLSIVQVAFLPGYLALRAARLTEGLWRTLMLSFALSLVINHFLVLALVLVGCYRPGVVYAVFAVELALPSGPRGVARLSAGERLTGWRFGSGGRRGGRSRAAGPSARLRGGLPADCRLCRPRAYHAGDIFQQWDAVVSWNRWAIDWAANGLPRTHRRISATAPQQPVAELRLYPRQLDLVLRQGVVVPVLPVSAAGHVRPRPGDGPAGILAGRAVSPTGC